ncbi:MAG: hypothetical protein HC906_09350 [Bacteroidales bacterium]|nr:hypothetical protein [Bacteroidales bacterium]
MKDKLKYIMTHGNCPSPDDLHRYVQGSLPVHQRFEIENHLADCEICSDVVEGYSYVTAESLSKAEEELSKKLKNRLREKENKRAVLFNKRLAIAASIAIIALSVYFFQKLVNRTEEKIVANELYSPENLDTLKEMPVVADNETKPEEKRKEAVVYDEKPVTEQLKRAGSEEQKIIEIEIAELEYQAEGIEIEDISSTSVNATTPMPSKAAPQAMKEKSMSIWNEEEKKRTDGKRFISGKIFDEDGNEIGWC